MIEKKVLYENTAQDLLAYELIEWALHSGNHEEEAAEWPEGLPSPKDITEDVHTANELFLMCSARLLLHESAHIVLKHSTDPATEESKLKEEEFEADQWADESLLKGWNKDSVDTKVFIKRTLGIAFSHAPKLVFGADKTDESHTHPNPNC